MSVYYETSAHRLDTIYLEIQKQKPTLGQFWFLDFILACILLKCLNT